MASPPSPGIAQIPTNPSSSKPIQADRFHPIPIPSGAEDQLGRSTYDYTENAPQAIVDAIAIENARREKEAPDLMIGSLESWDGTVLGELIVELFASDQWPFVRPLLT
jgi:cation-transporting ATPase 13A2